MVSVLFLAQRCFPSGGRTARRRCMILTCYHACANSSICIKRHKYFQNPNLIYFEPNTLLSFSGYAPEQLIPNIMQATSTNELKCFNFFRIFCITGKAKNAVSYVIEWHQSRKMICVYFQQLPLINKWQRFARSSSDSMDRGNWIHSAPITFPEQLSVDNELTRDVGYTWSRIVDSLSKRYQTMCIG